MKIREAIEIANELKPNAISDKVKLRWLSELDGKIAADVMLQSIQDLQQMKYRYPEDMDTEMLVLHPHDDIYPAYLMAQIDLANEEFDRYANSMAQYNAKFSSFVCWFANTYDPANGYNREEW